MPKVYILGRVATPLLLLRLPRPQSSLPLRFSARLCLSQFPTRNLTTKMSAIGSKPYLSIGNGDGRKAIAWYVKVFGAKVNHAYEMGERVGHAEIQIGSTGLMTSDAFPGISKTPADLGGSPVTFMIEYPSGSKDVYDLAVKEGATVVEGREYKEQPWGWNAGTVKDPFGYTWTIGEDSKKWGDEELTQNMGMKDIKSEF
jgi:PhnB protein